MKILQRRREAAVLTARCASTTATTGGGDGAGGGGEPAVMLDLRIKTRDDGPFLCREVVCGDVEMMIA
jgi:hypothetical protein